MGRRSRPDQPPWIKGAPAVCDACGRRCITLDQAGIPCYHCREGVFLPREAWDFWACPGCNLQDPFCPACHGHGWVAVPREMPADEAAAILRRLPDRYVRRGEAVPAVIAERTTAVVDQPSCQPNSEAWGSRDSTCSTVVTPSGGAASSSYPRV